MLRDKCLFFQILQVCILYSMCKNKGLSNAQFSCSFNLESCIRSRMLLIITRHPISLSKIKNDTNMANKEIYKIKYNITYDTRQTTAMNKDHSSGRRRPCPHELHKSIYFLLNIRYVVYVVYVVYIQCRIYGAVVRAPPWAILKMHSGGILSTHS